MENSQYFVTPRMVYLTNTRSRSPYDDRLVVLAQIHSGDPHPQDLGKREGEKIFQQKAAHLGFYGDKSPIELKDDAWGLQDGWRMAIPASAEAQGKDIWLEVTVTNVRNVPNDNYIWAFVKAASSVGALIVASEEADVSATIVAVANDFGIAADDLIDLAGKGVDVVKGIFGSRNVPCVGPVFQGSIRLNGDKIDSLPAGDGDIDSDTAMETALYYTSITSKVAIASQGECRAPNANVDLQIERRTVLLFPTTPFSTSVTPRFLVTSESVLGRWVDENSVISRSHQVEIVIEPGPTNDVFKVAVIERNGPVIVLQETFDGVRFSDCTTSLPGPDVFATARPGGVLLPAGRHHFPGPVGTPGRPTVSTRILSMRWGDYGTSFIGFWTRVTLDANARPVSTDQGLFYNRTGYAQATDAATWLVHPGRVLG